MTRALPLQTSPPFLTYETFSQQIKSLPAAVETNFLDARTPKRRARTSTNTVPSKIKRQSRPHRPTYFKMIEEAVFENYENRKGVSLIIIKRYLQKKYNIDVKKSAKRICKCIRESSSTGGNLKQVKGSGANGSFALASNVRKRMQLKKEKSFNADLLDTKDVSMKIKKVNASKAKIQKTKTPATRIRAK